MDRRLIFQPDMPDKQAEITGGEEAKERRQKHMAHDEHLPFGPIGVGEVEGVDQNARSPVDADEGGETERGAVATQEVGVQSQGQNPKRDDGEHSEAALYPDKLAVERRERVQVLSPSEACRNLKARDQDEEVPGTCQPEVEIEETSHEAGIRFQVSGKAVFGVRFFGLAHRLERGFRMVVAIFMDGRPLWSQLTSPSNMTL
jgi:hypothetical protein